MFLTPRPYKCLIPSITLNNHTFNSNFLNKNFIDILSKQRIPVEEQVAKDLIEKLDVRNLDKNTNLKEILYSVVDAITKTYNKNYAKGLTEEKMMN